MEPTPRQVDILLSYWGHKTLDLNFPIKEENAATIERRMEFYSFAFELLKRDDGFFAMSTSPVAQLRIRWLVFAIPESFSEKFVSAEGVSVKSES